MNLKRTTKAPKGTSFTMYKLTNPNSVCGFSYLALSPFRQVYFSISDNHFSIQSIYWEVEQWIAEDYEEIPARFNFDFGEFSDFIKHTLFEVDFSLNAFTNSENQIYALTFAFGKFENYHELEYYFKNGDLKKECDRVVTENNTVDYFAFMGITKMLKEFLNFKSALFISGNR